MNSIASFIEAHLLRVQAEIEKACERSLVGGVCGVLVVRHANGDATVSVDPGVPYGHIYERNEP